MQWLISPKNYNVLLQPIENMLIYVARTSEYHVLSKMRFKFLIEKSSALDLLFKLFVWLADWV